MKYAFLCLTLSLIPIWAQKQTNVCYDYLYSQTLDYQMQPHHETWDSFNILDTVSVTLDNNKKITITDKNLRHQTNLIFTRDTVFHISVDSNGIAKDTTLAIRQKQGTLSISKFDTLTESSTEDLYQTHNNIFHRTIDLIRLNSITSSLVSKTSDTLICNSLGQDSCFCSSHPVCIPDQYDTTTIKRQNSHYQVISHHHGSRSKSEILNTVRANSLSLKKVFNFFQKQGLKGARLPIKFTIEPSGRVIQADIVHSTSNNTEFDQEVLFTVKSWDFGSFPCMGNTTITLPLTFSE